MNPIEQAISAGRSAIDSGDPHAARVRLSGIDHPEAAYLLAIADTQLGMLGEAIGSYERALALEPNFDQARRALARLLVDLERYEDALPEYETVLTTTRSACPRATDMQPRCSVRASAS